MFTSWSDTVLQSLGEYRELMFDAERYLWAHPQTGFKEWEAHRYLKDRFSSLGFAVTEAGDIPGFYLDIDTGREGPAVAVLGELDALILPEHPECDKKTGAVHACGHHCQAASLPGIAAVLSKPEVLSKLCGKIRIVAVPAEELIELDERRQMQREGKLRHCSGKPEFMRRGYFDGVDIGIMLHGDCAAEPGLRVGQGTSGIVAKRVTYRGSVNKGGACPENGVNALYAANTALSAVNALRETFPHSQNVRVQSVIDGCGGTVQFMPSKVVIDSNVRAYDYATLMDVNEKVNRAYAAAAAAYGAEVTIEDMEVYLPENGDDSPALAEIAYNVGCDLYGSEHVMLNRDRSFRSVGGSDMGNLGAVIPCLQPYVCSPGLWGHSAAFRVESPEYAVLYHAAVLAAMACVLLEDGAKQARRVIAEYKPVFPSMQAYFREMDAFCRPKNAVEYGPDGSARLNWK